MQTNHDKPTLSLGDLVAASYDVGHRIAGDSSTAAALATRHLERVLVRGSNLRMTAAIARLARELGATNSRSVAPRSIALAAGR